MPLDTQPAALIVAIAALTSVVSAAGFSSCYGSAVAGHGRTTDLTVISVSLGNMMNAVWLVLAATWVKQGHGGAGAWTVILIVTASALVAGAMALRIKPRRPSSWAPWW